MKILHAAATLTLVSLLSTAPLMAEMHYSTVESRVILDSPASPTGEKVIMITGPDKIQYRVSAPQAEIARLTQEIRANPQTVVSFNGEVADEGGVKVFRVQNWKKVETTTTTTSTDSLGNKEVKSKTETHTEHAH